MIKSRVEIKHFSIVGLMSPGWVRTHSDFCWTRGLGLGLWPTGLGLGLGLWSSGLGLGLWSNGLGLTPDGLGLWSYGLGLGLGLWPCGLGLTAGLTSPDSLQHCCLVMVAFSPRSVFNNVKSETSSKIIKSGKKMTEGIETSFKTQVSSVSGGKYFRFDDFVSWIARRRSAFL